MSQTSLPPWARIKQLPLEMVAGHDFRPGDTLYFSERAYPRILWKKLSDSSWSVLVQRDDRHALHARGQISIDPDAHYVIKRATSHKPASGDGFRLDNFFHNRPLTQIRTDGEYLEVGDVLYLDAVRKRAEILHIGGMKLTPDRGHVRPAKLDFLDLHKVADYTFGGFSLQLFRLIAGPKFAAARRDPERIIWVQGPNYWHWKG
jgi:hypothetical protein